MDLKFPDLWMYVEWWDEETNQWNLSKIPSEIAIVAVIQDPLHYHIIDESAIEFEGRRNND